LGLSMPSKKKGASSVPWARARGRPSPAGIAPPADWIVQTD
jgi:hypothetical protein